MLHLLRRHRIPIVAHFEHSSVLTYAFPEEQLLPLLPSGLTLETYNGYGFLAIALVQTRSLRPKGFPEWVGQDFFLSGYRLFARHTIASGRSLRGLYILRSDTNRRRMAVAGNLMTHYNYRLADVKTQRDDTALEIELSTPNAEADLHVKLYTDDVQDLPPEGSPFPDLKTARKFAGPLPFTFNYEKLTHSIIRIEGVRKNWEPKPIRAEIKKATFFDSPPFTGMSPILANAFHVSDIPYEWKRGIREPLSKDAL
jgi:hypothetical protein